LAALPGMGRAETVLPDPFGPPQHQWASAPSGKPWGSAAGIERGPHGEIWTIDRCGANSCDGSDLAPIIELDTRTGKAIRSIGAGLFVFPHGLHVDRDGNIWVTDGAISADGGKGLQVVKLSPSGQVLLRLGTAGQRGDDATHFMSPTDVVTDSQGDIYVADGHAPIAPFIPPGNDTRIMKFDRHGKFLLQWGRPGSGPGEFANPHALAIDAEGRILVADRGNSRTQVFTPGGKFVAAWKQLGRPSGYYVDAAGALYSIDADSTEASNPGYRKGVYIGDAATGTPRGFVPDEAAGEGVVVAPDGNMYGAVNVAPHGITRYLRK